MKPGGPHSGHVVLARGRWREGQVEAWVEDQARPTTPSLEAVIAEEWERRMALAREQGQDLFDGRLWRLCRWEHEPGVQPEVLRLPLGPCGYREFVGTNLYHPELLSRHPWDHLANPVGTSALLATADGHTVLGRRSQRVAFHRGYRHAFGGMLEEEDQGPKGDVDVFAAMRRELREEVGLTDPELQDLACLALVRDREIHQPELLFEAAVPLTVAELQRRWEDAPSREEHQSLILIRRDPDALRAAWKDPSPLSGVAAAALQQVHRQLTTPGGPS